MYLPSIFLVASATPDDCNIHYFANTKLTELSFASTVQDLTIQKAL